MNPARRYVPSAVFKSRERFVCTPCVQQLPSGSSLIILWLWFIYTYLKPHCLYKLTPTPINILRIHNLLRNLEIGAQFVDLEFAQRNLEIAQIPKMRGTYMFCSHLVQFLQPLEKIPLDIVSHYTADHHSHALVMSNNRFPGFVDMIRALMSKHFCKDQ